MSSLMSPGLSGTCRFILTPHKREHCMVSTLTSAIMREAFRTETLRNLKSVAVSLREVRTNDCMHQE